MPHLPAFSCYIPLIKDIATYTHLRCPRLALYHRNDGLCRRPCRCKRRRGSCVMGKREHAFSLSAYKSADRERASSLFVCPTVRPYFFCKPFLLYPLLYSLRTCCFRAACLPFSFIGLHGLHPAIRWPAVGILLQNKCGVACRCKPSLAEIFLGASLQAYFCRPVCRKAIPPHSKGRKIPRSRTSKNGRQQGKNKICQI